MKALNILTGIISLIACVDTAYGGYGNSYGNNHGNNYGSNYGNGNYGNTQGGGDRVKFTDIKALTFRAGTPGAGMQVQNRILFGLISSMNISHPLTPPHSSPPLPTQHHALTRENVHKPARCTRATDEMHQRSLSTVPNSNDSV